ncbi:MAG TPA: hypothetical protein VF021_10210 [Longimicrobiales bacterium]
MNQPPIVPIAAFNLSTLVPRSVASLYSHLVTRPTGRALRMGIESQICELGTFCVSVLDFSQVVVLDYSCADEVVAKLIQRYQRDDRPTDAYFIARGLAEEHRDPIEEVLSRHQLALVAEMDGAFGLLGHATPYERAVWSLLQQLRSAECIEVAAQSHGAVLDAVHALDTLVERRAVLRPANARRYYSLTALLSL